MELKCEFSIHRVTDEYIFIVDIGTQSKSVTNDVVNVLEFLSDVYKIGKKRLFYRDSGGEIDEIVHDCGKFVRFAPGFKGINENLHDL
jgi:hypothetical protein